MNSKVTIRNHTRLIITVACGVITVIDQILIRPNLRGQNSFVDILLGSLPNFLTALGISLFIISIRSSKKKNSNIISSVIVGILLYEILNSGGSGYSFGGTFDWNDIIATFIGGYFAYFIEKKYAE